MSTTRIEIDGVDFTGDVSGIAKVRVSTSKKDGDNKITKRFTNELTFMRAAYTYMKPILIDNPLGKNASCAVKIYDTCCKDDDGNYFLVFEGVIRGDSIDWCIGDCFFTGQCLEHTEATKKIDCLKSTLITDNWNGIMTASHPRMTYCDELRPNWLHDVVIILGIIINIILLILTPIVAILSVIISTVCFLVDLFGGDCPDELEDGILDNFLEFKERLNESILGCGRQHPSPLVRTYISNVCDKCGIPWQSSILKNPASDYFNTVYLYAPSDKGTRDTTVKIIERNTPIHTGETFLQELTTPFNADFNVKSGVLYFERKDFFWNNPNWIEANNVPLDGKVCLHWRDDDKVAFLNIKYTEDPVDKVANEARDFYREIVEWNSPFNDLQKGFKDVQIPYGPTRWRKDGIDRDVIGTYAGAPFFSGLIAQFDDAIIMASGNAFQARLLIWDGISLTDSFVKKYSIAGYPLNSSQNYNYPYQLHEHNVIANTIYASNAPGQSIYARFHSIDNPKVSPDLGKDFDFQFQFDCEHLRTFDIFKNVGIYNDDGSYMGSGRMEEVAFDFEKRLCTVSGKI